MQDCTTLLIDFPLQRELILEGIDAVILSFVDDVAGGTNESSPYEMLARMLKYCIKANFTVMPEDIQCAEEITLLGKFLNRACQITIAARHLEAIQSLRHPTTPAEARKTVAFFNYLRDFVPRFAESTSAMRSLMNNQNPTCHDVKLEFERIQQRLVRHCPLKAVPIDAHLHLYADFSKNGFGGVVAYTTQRDDRLILSRFISKTAKGAEPSYVVIEGEACATLWIIRQSQKDIMRTKKTTVWTDHRPLIGAITNFSFDSPMTPRLKKFISMIKIYAVELSGKFQLLADLLSRNPSPSH